VRIALDTNILSPVLSDPSERGQAIADVLDSYNVGHDLIICAVVYAELLAIPGAQVAALDAALAGRSVAVDWALSRETWIAAGQAYAAYAKRRREERPPTAPRRLLADFILGAHALHQADALLTFNAGDFQTNFPALQIIAPTI
jgi:predicted nucleic acid-binding protein